ncbi:hypothetical protein PG5_04250 [Pseudomonas sp. G5(2012)]|nr:hypothetical protein PG5_04250 [Pseudomonas sp. G5(2012)]
MEHPTNANPNKPNNHIAHIVFIVISITDHSLISVQAAWENPE